MNDIAERAFFRLYRWQYMREMAGGRMVRRYVGYTKRTAREKVEERLIHHNYGGVFLECFMEHDDRFFIDNTPPVLSDMESELGKMRVDEWNFVIREREHAVGG